MATKCKSYIDAISTIEYHNEKEEKFYEHDLHLSKEDQNILNGLFPKMAKWTAKKIMGQTSKVKEAQIKKGIEELYGGKNDRLVMLTKLISIRKANPGIAGPLERFLMESVTRMQTKGKVEWNVIKKERQLDWSSIPLAVLRSAVNFSERLVAKGMGENLGKGRIGKFEVDLTTARKMTLKEKSGALFRMRAAVRDFPMEQGRMIKRFTDADLSVKGGRNYGINDILSSIEGLAMHESLKGKRTMSTEIILVEMFQRYLSRDQGYHAGKTEKEYKDANRSLRINEDGSMEIATGWEKRRDSKGKVVFYKDSGEPIYQYTNYVSAKEAYGDEYIEFNDDMMKRFLGEAERYDKLHAELWEFMEKEFGQTKKDLFKLLKTLVPANYTDKDIQELFFERDPTLFGMQGGRRRKDQKSWNDLSEDQQNMIQFIHENASKYQILKPFVFEGGHVDVKDTKGRASFPVIYNRMKFPFMWDDMIERFQKEEKEIDIDLANPDLELETRHKLLQKKKALVSKILRAVKIRDNMDDYPIDMQSGVRVMLGADSKHTEHISNAFNVLEGRRDKGAYYAYLKHNMAQLQRAKLAIELIESLKIAESHEVRDIIMNWYKVSMYQPDAKSGLGPFDFSSEGVSTLIGKANIQVSAAKIDARMRTILSYFSANLLKGWGTAFQNYTAVIEKVMVAGPKAVLEAYKIMERGGKELEQIIALSGVVDFREFFSRSLTNDALILGAENRQILDMAGGMVDYWAKVEKMEKRNLTKKQKAGLRAKYKQELEESIGYTIETMPGKERIKKRNANLWDQHRNNLLRKYVDYAINKEYEAAPYIRNARLKGIMSLAEKWAEFQRTNMPTMGKTEAILRTLSFIIGVRKAMLMEFIPNKPLSQLVGDDLNKAIEIGRDYVELMDFGLSRQDLGQIGHSNIGAFFTEFKVWSMQKFAADLDKIRGAVDEMSDPNVAGIDFSAIKDLIVLTAKYKDVPTDVLRTTHPRVATFRTWLFTQGLWTALWDITIMGPLAAPGVRVLARLLPIRNPFFRSIGGSTSDLISLILSPITIGIFLAAGEGEDNWDKIVDFFLRKTFIGFGGKWMIDNFIALIMLLGAADEEEAAEKVIRQLQPVSPPVIKELIKPVYMMLKPKK